MSALGAQVRADRRGASAAFSLNEWLPSELDSASKAGASEHLRQISLLTLRLLTVLDSNFPGTPLWTWESHPLKSNYARVKPSEIHNVSRETGRTQTL